MQLNSSAHSTHSLAPPHTTTQAQRSVTMCCQHAATLVAAACTQRSTHIPHPACVRTCVGSQAPARPAPSSSAAQSVGRPKTVRHHGSRTACAAAGLGSLPQALLSRKQVQADVRAVGGRRGLGQAQRRPTASACSWLGGCSCCSKQASKREHTCRIVHAAFCICLTRNDGRRV